MTNAARVKTRYRTKAAISHGLLLRVASVIAGVMLAGCGPGHPAGKVKVVGTVTFDGKPLAAEVLEGVVINFAGKEGKASGATALSPNGAFTVYLVPGEYDVAIRDLGGTMQAPEQPGLRPTYRPKVIASRYTSADTSGISITAAADSNPVTIAIEKQ